jgi:hypothetical protein
VPFATHARDDRFIERFSEHSQLIVPEAKVFLALIVARHE